MAMGLTCKELQRRGGKRRDAPIKREKNTNEMRKEDSYRHEEWDLAGKG